MCVSVSVCARARARYILSFQMESFFLYRDIGSRKKKRKKKIDERSTKDKEEKVLRSIDL